MQEPENCKPEKTHLCSVLSGNLMKDKHSVLSKSQPLCRWTPIAIKSHLDFRGGFQQGLSSNALMETEKSWDMKGIILAQTKTNCKELQNFNEISSDLLAKRQMKCKEIHREKKESYSHIGCKLRNTIMRWLYMQENTNSELSRG